MTARMVLDDVKKISKAILEREDVGKKFIERLAGFIDLNLKNQAVKDDSQATPYRLAYSFGGLRLIFKVSTELKALKDDSIVVTGRVEAYRLEGDKLSEATEVPLLKGYEFDGLGNTTEPRGYSYQDFSEKFLTDAFAKCISKTGVVIYPLMSE